MIYTGERVSISQQGSNGENVLSGSRSACVTGGAGGDGALGTWEGVERQGDSVGS